MEESTIFSFFSFIFGLVGLICGAELLVRKAHFFARRFRVRPFIMGILLLGMGTSAPEWAVSVLSSLKGLPNLALGNVLGSNIFNIFIVLSVIMLGGSQRLSSSLIHKDSLFLFFSSFILILLFWNYFLSRWDALILIIIFILYVLMSIKSSKNKEENSVQNTDQVLFSFKANTIAYLCIVLGFILLILGSHLTIKGAIGLGEQIGMSERVVGILMVSVGTSLPELVVSIVAIFKNHKSMAVGNVIGSNIFNTYAILGTSGLIDPINMDLQAVILDLPLLLVAYTVLLSIVYFSFCKHLQKILPYLFLSGYVVYITYLISI